MIARSIFARFLIASGIAASSLLSADFSAPLSARPSSEDSRAPAARLTPVTRQEVWQAVESELRGRGLSESQLPRVEDLELPLALPAIAGRRLRVSSACWDEGSRRTQFRLECAEPGQCLPFLVHLRNYPSNSARDHVNADVGARAGSCRLASGARLAPEIPRKPAVRAGERATAVFLADRLRLTASVTCLQRGHEGEIIRVRSLDGHIFRARISGPGVLQALPQE